MSLKIIKNSLIVLVLMMDCQVFTAVCMQDNEQPIVYALRLQEFRKRNQEKNDFKIKMRRMSRKPCSSSRLNCMKKRRSKRRSKKAERDFVCKQNFNPVIKHPLELPLEATLTAENLRILIQDDNLRIASEEKKSPEVLRAELERVLDENDFTGTRKGPFRVPHCYNYLSRILMQAKRLSLSSEERESLKAILVASQLTLEEQQEIACAFQAITSNKPVCANKEIWNQKVFDLAIDCDGKSLLERAYATGDEQIIKSVKNIQESFLKSVVLFD